MERRVFKDLFSRENEVAKENTSPESDKPISFANVLQKPFALRPLKLNVPQSPVSQNESETGLQEDTIYSPVTSLALNLNDLHTECYDGTPKRKLGSMFCPEVPLDFSFNQSSAEVASITDNARSSFENILEDNGESPVSTKPKENRTMRRVKSGFRRVKSMATEATSPIRGSPKRRGEGLFDRVVQSPVARSPLSGIPRPNLDEDNSQDSGIGSDKPNLEDFRFATPVGVAPRRSRQYSEESNSPLRYSPVNDKLSPQCLFPRSRVRSLSPSFEIESTTVSLMKSPIQRSKSTESTGTDSDDDGFLELIDFDDEEITCQAPKGLSSLLTAPLVNRNLISANKENIQTPNTKRGAPRGLFRSPSAPRLGVHENLSPSPAGSPFELFSRPLGLSNKRQQNDETPVGNKRRKSVIDHERSEKENAQPRPAPKFQRSISDSETHIKYSLGRSDREDLIGDLSRSYCLPTIPGKHSDLRSISSETMIDLLDNKYSHIVEEFVVVDCRYPYEFNGGHIKGARNLYTKDEIFRELMASPKFVQNPDKRYIIIFHCEFSSERGPKMSRFLRDQDRIFNAVNYPALNYPELYLLDGGYKVFYEQFPTYNFPQSYKLMLDKDHSQDLKHFRAKSKSWAGEKCRGSRAGLKF